MTESVGHTVALEVDWLQGVTQRNVVGTVASRRPGLMGPVAPAAIEASKRVEVVVIAGDTVKNASAVAQANRGLAIGAGIDVAVETADVVLMCSDPLDVTVALGVGRGAVRTERHNLGWAIGYDILAGRSRPGSLSPPSVWCSAQKSRRSRWRQPGYPPCPSVAETGPSKAPVDRRDLVQHGGVWTRQ